MEWQPIESAPKDGKRIICYRPYAYFQIGMAAWVTNGHGKSYWSDLAGNSYSWCKETPPIYWMPLPDPPAPRDSVKEKADG